MFHRRLWFILICSVTVETIFRSSLVIKRIDEISLQVNIIQGVSCERKQRVEEMNKCHLGIQEQYHMPVHKAGAGDVKPTSAPLFPKIR